VVEVAEIPAELRRRLDRELRAAAFDQLHAEAVERGVLPRAPRAWSEGPFGALLRGLLFLGLGVAAGVVSVVVVLFLLTSYPFFLG